MKYLKVTLVATCLFWVGSLLALIAGYGFQMFVFATGFVFGFVVAIYEEYLSELEVIENGLKEVYMTALKRRRNYDTRICGAMCMCSKCQEERSYELDKEINKHTPEFKSVKMIRVDKMPIKAIKAGQRRLKVSGVNNEIDRKYFAELDQWLKEIE